VPGGRPITHWRCSVIVAVCRSVPIAKSVGHDDAGPRTGRLAPNGPCRHAVVRRRA